MATRQHTNSSKRTLSNVVLIVLLALLLGGEGYFGQQLYRLSGEQEQLSEDYAMVNNITFGIFSVDLWRDKMAGIVTRKIKGFKITAEQKKQMRIAIEAQLHGMVNQVVKEFTKPQKSLGGKLKKFAFRQFVEPKELHGQVPAFTKTIIDRLTSQRATAKLKGIATDKFEQLADQTFDSTQVAIAKVTHKMYAKYHVNSRSAFNSHIEQRLKNIRAVTYNYAYAMLGCVGVVILLWLLLRKQSHLQTSLFVMSLPIALVLLIAGVTVSIIEVDARLNSLDFLMMGERVTFDNQVLFFQSKSILGIARVLISQPKPDSITVGVLIMVFVIALPILRMAARGLHMLCRPLIAENGITRYLAFESGKWDMADVMVVGIGMTYIGLNGILKSQLKDLNIKTELLTTATVNYTSLQPGYLVFTGYVVFAMMLSYMLKRISC